MPKGFTYLPLECLAAAYSADEIFAMAQMATSVLHAKLSASYHIHLARLYTARNNTVPERGYRSGDQLMRVFQDRIRFDLSRGPAVGVHH